jgi:hypothetical protein
VGVVGLSNLAISTEGMGFLVQGLGRGGAVTHKWNPLRIGHGSSWKGYADKNLTQKNDKGHIVRRRGDSVFMNRLAATIQQVYFFTVTNFE